MPARFRPHPAYWSQTPWPGSREPPPQGGILVSSCPIAASEQQGEPVTLRCRQCWCRIHGLADVVGGALDS